MNLKPRKLSSCTKLISNGNTVTEPKNIAQLFNNYFVNVGPTLARNIPNQNKHHSSYLSERNDKNFDFSPTNEREVLGLLLNMDDNKAMGPDGIGIKFIKVASPVISSTITKLFNA